MVPRLSDTGEPIKLKMPNQQTGKTIKEERKLVDTFSEFYLSDRNDIETFIHLFAVNATDFKYNEYFVDAEETKVSKLIVPA